MAARRPVLVEEFSLTVENKLHSFAICIDRVTRDDRKLSIIVPDDIRQSRPESGILDAGHEFGNDGGLFARRSAGIMLRCPFMTN